jgi:hypothetical protein
MATSADPSKFTCWLDPNYPGGSSFRATSDLDSIDIVTPVPFATGNLTLLQNAIALFEPPLSTPGGNFLCSFSPSFGAVAGQIKITVSNWELRLPIGRSYSVPPPVSIQQLTIQNNSATTDLSNFKVSGGLFYEIDLFATSHHISQGSLEYLVLRPTTTAGMGGLILGNPSALTPDTGYIQYISYDHIVIQDDNPGGSAIQYNNTVTGTSHHCYHDLQYFCDTAVTSPTTVFQFASGFYLGELFIDQLCVNFASSHSGSNGSVVFNFQYLTTDSFCRGLDVVQLFLEGHNSGDIIFNFQGPPSGTGSPLEFSGYVQNLICTTGGGTHSIVNVSPRAAWSTANLDANKLRIGFGNVGLATGNLTLGTLLQTANWWVFVDFSAPNGVTSAFPGIFGQVTDFVGNGTNEGVDKISPAGDTNSLTAGQLYQVRCGSALITWNSGQTASLKDPYQTTIVTSLPSPVLVPEGYYIEFSGTGTMYPLCYFFAD